LLIRRRLELNGGRGLSSSSLVDWGFSFLGIPVFRFVCNLFVGAWVYGSDVGVDRWIMRIRLGLRVLAYIWSSGKQTLQPPFPLLFPFLSFLSYNHLHYLLSPIQSMMVSLIMHFRFIFLSLLHRAIANQELPLFGTNNLFPPATDLLPVTAVASMASTSTAASGFASQAVETRDGNEKYVHHPKRQEAPFPIKTLGYLAIDLYSTMGCSTRSLTMVSLDLDMPTCYRELGGEML